MDIFIIAIFCMIQPIVFSQASKFVVPAKDEKRYEAEIKAGSHAYMMENKHVYHAHKYRDLNRRHSEKEVLPEMEDEDAVGRFHENIQMSQKVLNKGEDPRLIPMRASPELVMAVAKESAKMPVPYEDYDGQAKILRSGDYWNGFWKEEVDPATLLRTNDIEEEPNPEDLESIQAKIMPGSKLYHLVSVLQRMSPKLLYIINKPM